MNEKQVARALASHKEVTDLCLQIAMKLIALDEGQLLTTEKEAEDFGYLLHQELMQTMTSVTGFYTRKARGQEYTKEEWEADALRLGKRLLSRIDQIEEQEEAEWLKGETRH